MFEFRHIDYLYTLAGIPVLVLLYIWLIRWKKTVTKKIGDPSLVQQLVQGYSPKLFMFKFILITLAFGLCAFAVSDIVKPEGQEKIIRTGIDVMIALDVSKSMLAEDIKPNRLERAKQVIGKIIDKLSNDRIGLVIFAGKAYLQMPMTTDHSAAKMYLSAASPDDVPTQGTVFSDALKMCYAAFNTKEKKYRTIVLITDGEDHDEDAIKVTGELADQGIMVNTIGIGSPAGAPIMDKETNDYKKDENGNTVISKLNEEELKEIAAKGNGLYQLYTNTDEVTANLQTKLSSLGETTLVDSAFANYKTYFNYFLWAALVFLVLELFIAETWKQKSKLIALLAFIFISSGSTAQVNKEISSGNNAYKKQQYLQASKNYSNALKQDPQNNIATYNLGNSFYYLEKPDGAINEYDKSIEHSTDDLSKSRAYYNKGVALQKQNKLSECIEAYKNSLKLSPTDEEARQNLERALIKLKQQQKQDKPDKQDQKQKKQKDKKDQKDKQDKDKNQKDKEPEQPKPQPSRISKQDAEEKLKSLLDHEKDLQDKLHKVKASGVDKPKKDW